MRWSTSLKTAPTQEPIELDEAKRHLRIELTDTEDDALIEALIVASREVAETRLGRAIPTQTHYLKLNAFPSGAIILPRPPVQSITSVTYVDTDGDTQTWSSSLYQTSIPTGPKALHARIEPAYLQSYPSTRDQMDAVTVEYICGYLTTGIGTVTTDLPSAIKAAMLLLIGHLYENREAVVVNSGIAAVMLPLAIESLLEPYVVPPVVL